MAFTFNFNLILLLLIKQLVSPLQDQNKYLVCTLPPSALLLWQLQGSSPTLYKGVTSILATLIFISTARLQQYCGLFSRQIRLHGGKPPVRTLHLEVC